jgi:hypothetical protein
MSWKSRVCGWRQMVIFGVALVMLAGVAGAQANVVHFKELLPFVDLKIPGWQQDGKPGGTTLKQGKVSVSEARATYRNADQTLEIVVMDFQGKSLPFLAAGQPLEMESTEERVRTTTVQDFKALETFRKSDKQGELNISVADRFWVKIDGDGMDTPEVLKTVAQQMDLKKLAGLGK